MSQLYSDSTSCVRLGVCLDNLGVTKSLDFRIAENFGLKFDVFFILARARSIGNLCNGNPGFFVVKILVWLI